MRDTKFRGKRKDNGEWVYGNLLIQNAYDLKDGTHKPQPLKTFIREQNIRWRNKDKCWEYFSYEVSPETVGQFTGRKDSKRTKEYPEGQEVYGNDKLQDSSGDIGLVYWKENIAGFYCKWGDGSDMPLNTGVAVNRCKVIGNIHENPELLDPEKAGSLKNERDKV